MQQALGRPATRVLVTKSDIVVHLTSDQAEQIIQQVNDGSTVIYVNDQLINVQNDLRGIYTRDQYAQSSIAQRRREQSVPKIETPELKASFQVKPGTAEYKLWRDQMAGIRASLVKKMSA